MNKKRSHTEPKVSYGFFSEIRNAFDRKLRSLARRINRKLNALSAGSGQLDRFIGCLLFFGTGSLLCLLLFSGKCNSDIYPAAGMQTLQLAPMLPARADTSGIGLNKIYPGAPYPDTLSINTK